VPNAPGFGGERKIGLVKEIPPMTRVVVSRNAYSGRVGIDGARHEVLIELVVIT
jgi:hypothetical protein